MTSPSDNALQRAYGAKVTKHHGWLQAKNYWFISVVAATSGALQPATLRLLNDLAALPTPRSNVRSTPDGGAAVQCPGLSYTAHWEALGSTLRLLTTRSIPCTGPVWGCSRRTRRFCCVLPAPVGLQFFALRFATVCH